jgi:hypothetical protein
VVAISERDYATASGAVERALAINPNSALGWGVAAIVSAFVGDYATALDRAAQAIRLNPLDPLRYKLRLPPIHRNREPSGRDSWTPEPFSFDGLIERARQRAAQLYVPPPAPAPELVQQIDYDAHYRLAFKPEYALFGNGPGPYPVSETRLPGRGDGQGSGHQAGPRRSAPYNTTRPTARPSSASSSKADPWRSCPRTGRPSR